MKHDTAHEERQNAALAHLAGVLGSVCAHVGFTSGVKAANEVAAMLASPEPAPAAAPSDEIAPDALDASPAVEVDEDAQ